MQHMISTGKGDHFVSGHILACQGLREGLEVGEEEKSRGPELQGEGVESRF